MQRKKESLVLEVLPIDKTALRRLAADEGEGMAVVVRGLTRDAARERGFYPEKKTGVESGGRVKT